MREASDACLACLEVQQGGCPRPLRCSHGTSLCAGCSERYISSCVTDGSHLRSVLHPHCQQPLSAEALTHTIVDIERHVRPGFAWEFLQGLVRQDQPVEGEGATGTPTSIGAAPQSPESSSSAVSLPAIHSLIHDDISKGGAYLTLLLRVHFELQGRLSALFSGLPKLLQFKTDLLCPWAATVVQETIRAVSGNTSTMTTSLSVQHLAQKGLLAMAVHCPNCGMLLDQDPEECSAFYHTACGQHYCFVCFRGFPDSNGCHAHVMSAHGGLYHEGEERSRMHGPFKENACKIFLSLLPPPMRDPVLDEMIHTLSANPQLHAQDLAILQGVREIPDFIPYAEVVPVMSLDAGTRGEVAMAVPVAQPLQPPNALPPQEERGAQEGGVGDKGSSLLSWLRMMVAHTLPFWTGYSLGQHVSSMTKTVGDLAAGPSLVQGSSGVVATARDAGALVEARGVVYQMRQAVSSMYKLIEDAALGARHASTALPLPVGLQFIGPSPLDFGRAAVRVAAPPPRMSLPPLPPSTLSAVGTQAANNVLSDWMYASAGDALAAVQGKISWVEVARKQPCRVAVAGVKGAITSLVSGACFCSFGVPSALPVYIGVNVVASMVGTAIVLKASASCPAKKKMTSNCGPA